MRPIGHNIHRDQAVRDRQREIAGGGQIEVGFQVPISGTAKSAFGSILTDVLWFDVGFLPRQSNDPSRGRTPMFRSGIEVQPLGSAYLSTQSYPLVGMANLHHWEQNSDGLYVGAVCSIGMAAISDDMEVQIPFEGIAHLSFYGDALESPVVFENHTYQGT